MLPAEASARIIETINRQVDPSIALTGMRTITTEIISCAHATVIMLDPYTTRALVVPVGIWDEFWTSEIIDALLVGLVEYMVRGLNSTLMFACQNLAQQAPPARPTSRLTSPALSFSSLQLLALINAICHFHSLPCSRPSLLFSHLRAAALPHFDHCPATLLYFFLHCCNGLPSQHSARQDPRKLQCFSIR